MHHRRELGGAPQSLRNLIEHLDRRRFTPHVFAPPGPAAESFAEAGAIVHTGPVAAFTHIWASTYKGRRWLLLGRELVHAPAHVASLRRLLRNERFSLVHLNDSPLIPAALVAHRVGLPIVWHLRSALPTDGSLRSRAVRSLIRRLATATIAINADVGRSFDVGSVIIPNGVDLERFKPAPSGEARRILGLADGAVVISYFGFLYPYKGFRDFIEAARLVRLGGFDATFLIVGGAVRGADFFDSRFGRALTHAGLAKDHMGSAQVLVEQLGLEECVRFIPFTSETPSIFQASDIVVAPSRGPELGRPVLEASACGRPTVASGSLDGGGIIRPGETGELVPRRSPDALAATLELLIGRPEERRRLGENARVHAEDRFDVQRNAEVVMELYESILRRG